jgi:sulfatase modifying factor 1
MNKPANAIDQPGDAPHSGMVWIPGGTFVMGSDKHYPEEAPTHEVTVDGFWMDVHTVTNEEFRKFVEATKHVTSAERAPNPDDYPGAKPELLVPASVVFQKHKQRVDLCDCFLWWTYFPGANWRHPVGPARSFK